MKMSIKNRLKKLEERNKLVLKKNKLDKKNHVLPETEKNSLSDCILGTTPEGETVYFSLKNAPHLIIAGDAGSGKSVLVNQIVTSMMGISLPEELKFIIIDPTGIEFLLYKDSPYMLINPIEDLEDGYKALIYLTTLVSERYKIFSESKVTNIEEYNNLAEKFEGEKLPFIVLVIDGLPEFITQYKEVEQQIVDIVKIAKSAGVHVIITTNNPRAEILTGLIRNCISSRISLRMASQLSSVMVLNEKGAEELESEGDMLVKVNEHNFIKAKSFYNSYEELEEIFDNQKKAYQSPNLVNYKKVIQEYIEKKEEG